ncbi:uncharacterized protein [Heterodontus francisci]|uniref:uncharacterized protein n=1 Tax=Heterodontus francisci TaxID=7792 RepID=UPI00355C16F4
MNSGMRNYDSYGNFDSLGNYGTFPGRSTYWRKPLIPHLASVRTETDVNSRRQKEQIPYVLQDSTNHWAAHPRNVHGDPWTNQWESGVSSKAMMVKEVKVPKREGHWDRGGLEALEKWESKEKMEKYYKEKKKQETKEDSINLGRGWSSPDQVKRPLGNQQKQTRRPLPVLCEPIYEEWEPLYTRDLLQSPPINQPADYRQVEVYPFYKEQWTRGHWSHRDASNLSDHRELGPLKDPSEMTTSLSPNSFEGKGYKERPLKPPSYEMYMQMKKTTEQGKKIAQFENCKRDLQKSQPTVQNQTSFPDRNDLPPYVRQQPLSRERKHQGRYDILGSNVKAAFQELGFKPPQDRFSKTIADGLNYSEVARSEKMGPVNHKRRFIDPERFGELLTQQYTHAGYGTWHAMDKYLYPGVTQNRKEVSLPLYHTSGRSTKGKYKRSDLKHEGIEMQNPLIELDDRPREDDLKNNEGNRMKGEVLRSKKGEVVFCLISRPDTNQSVQASKSHTLPRVGRKSNVPSWPHDLEQSLLVQHEKRFYEGWDELKGSKSVNKEGVKPQYFMDGHAYPIKQESHSDGAKYGSGYDDFESHGTRNMNYSPNSDHHFSAANKKAPGSRMRQQQYDSDGEEITRWRNSDSTMRKEVWGFNRRSENSSDYLQMSRQKGVREQELGVKGSQWDRGHVKSEMGKTALFPGHRYRPDASLENHTEHDCKVSDLEQNAHGKPWTVKRQAWDASLDGVQQHFYSKCVTEERADVQNQHKERKLPEWKRPLHSSVRTGNWFKGGDVKWPTENDGVFIIDATAAIVKAEYISSPKKERVRFSHPIEAEGFKDSFEHDTRPESKKVSHQSAKGQELSETVKETVERRSPVRKIINPRAGQSLYYVEDLSPCNSSRNSQNSRRDLEKKEDLFPRIKVKESMKERATRILGLPIMDTDSTELQVKEKTGTEAEDKDIEVTGENCMASYLHTEKRSGLWIDDMVDNLGKSEKIIDGAGWKNIEPAIVGTLQPSNAVHDSLDEVMHNGEIDSGASDKADIQEENKIHQEIPGDKSSFLPVEHRSNTEKDEDSECLAPQKCCDHGSELPAQDLQDMVFESVSRIRRHTAPDSESDDEEVEQLLANEVIAPERSREENEVLSPGSTDSSTSADTVIMCSKEESLTDESQERLDTTDGENVCSECFPPEHEEPENKLSSQVNIEDPNLQELANADSWTHRRGDSCQEVFSTIENFLKELSQDQGESQPGGAGATNITHLEPSDGAKRPECVEMALEIKERERDVLSNSDTEMDGSETAGESDAECTGAVH